ncbi:MAG: 23S rRNA (adenine(2503)-C(2))-methyltransferase RlmN [Chlamydiales bacterium]|nr:23S rRNA (adenine(2503)-C(2))-methyltransferase RlmN [Chlamydiales bacterium]
MKIKILGSSLTNLREWFVSKGLKSFNANQVFEWLFKKGEPDFEKMTNLSLEVRALMAQELDVGTLELARTQESSDGETVKFLWKLSDDKLVESVLIMSGDRRTVCVSSQVGCPARCAFCASGRQGLIRNLELHEILAQVYQIDLWLKKKGETVSHVVYMGMGEPFRNYETVVASVRYLINPDFMGLSQRRITVSTVGVVEGITRFTQEGLKVNLVLSLHAPNQKLRQKVIPYAREYALETILDAMWHYADVTGRDVTFEYTLLKGINDGIEQAKELCQLLKNKQCTVNLIPYNPVDGLKLEKPTSQAVANFREVLEAGKIINTCRYTKGDDIAAACGQLAMQDISSLKVINS